MNCNELKFSFIIPVYKVVAYLRQCVESIQHQTYKDIEIILVDDGSPDSCPALCDRLATEDERIRVVHKENGGLSDARNAGMKVASGDYVIFVDGDDFWVGKDSLQKLVDTIYSNPECQFYNFNCSYFYSDNDNFMKWKLYSEVLTKPVSGSSAMRSLVASGTVPMSACLKAIDRQWLSDMGITFKVGQISEDIPWFINLLEKCEKCMFVNEYIYAYRQHVAGSITESGGERSYNSLLDIVNTELKKIDERVFTEEAKDALRSFLAYEVCILMVGVHNLPKEKQKSARKELNSLCWLLKYRQNPKVRMVGKVYDICGYTATVWALMMYNWYRMRRG